MNFLGLAWRVATLGAWGAGAVVAFIGSFPPGTTAWTLALVVLGAMLLLLVAKPPEALPCLVAFGSAVAIVIIGIVSTHGISALEPFADPSTYDSQAHFEIGTGARLVLVGGIVSCAGSFAFPLLGLWHHYRGPAR